MAKPYKLKKPTLGIDQLSDETELINDEKEWITSIREATNIDIDVNGHTNRRGGYTLKLTGTGYHSLYESRRGWLMLCHNEELGVYTTTSNTFTQLTTLAGSYLTSFDELNGNIYYANIGGTGMIRKNESAVRAMGVALPDVIPDFAVSTGSLAAGRYGVTYSFINDLGEESPLGPLMVITLTEQGGILGSLFTVAANCKYRVYMTTTDGTELYQAAEFDADTTTFLVAEHEQGRQPITQYLSLMPPGYILRAYNSRLFVATTDFVFYSEPFLPHLTNAGTGFLPTTGITSMVQPVEGGVYIGDTTGVRFYKGEDPSNFEVKDVSTEVPVFGTAISVPGQFLPEKLAKVDSAAVWLSVSGYNIGLPSGEVIRLHADQVKLPKYAQGCSAIAIKDGRKQLITPVNSNALADVSVALDSTTC